MTIRVNEATNTISGEPAEVIAALKAATKSLTQPSLPGLEGYAVTKRLIGTSGSFELSPEFEIDAAFMEYLEGMFGREVVSLLTWADGDGVAQVASLSFVVSDSRNTYHEDAEGEAGRIKKLVLKASALGLGEA